MGILYIASLLLNVAALTFLIYRIVGVVNEPLPKNKKAVIVTAGILLMIVPIAFLLRIIPLTPVFLLTYPVAVSFFVYLIRSEKNA